MDWLIQLLQRNQYIDTFVQKGMQVALAYDDVPSPLSFVCRDPNPSASYLSYRQILQGLERLFTWTWRCIKLAKTNVSVTEEKKVRD